MTWTTAEISAIIGKPTTLGTPATAGIQTNILETIITVHQKELAIFTLKMRKFFNLKENLFFNFHGTGVFTDKKVNFIPFPLEKRNVRVHVLFLHILGLIYTVDFATQALLSYHLY
jgi:hypothetical protein